MEEETSKDVKEEKKEERPLEQMTVKELREMAREIPNIAALSSMKKGELLETIRKAKEGQEKSIKEGAKEAQEEKEKPLDKMTAKELREIAIQIPGVTGVHAMKKDQLLEVLKKARGIKEEAPGRKRKRKAAKKEISIRELKQKILILKREKAAAGEARDRGKVNILRRRINRLKKQTRKVAQAA